MAALSVLSASGEALAYCRTRTCEFRQDIDCPTDARGCSTTGEFVYWDSKCVPFAVDRFGSVDEGISSEVLEQLVADGFEAWSDVACEGGGSPELTSGSQGRIACDAVEYDCNVREANSNLVMFRDDFDDSPVGLRFGVIALTTLTANLVTGELFDADIEINSRDEDFEVGGAGNVDPDEPRDLRGVVSHELGHLLGLSHSSERGALMRAAYEGTFAPAADDRAGMCAALGRSESDPSCGVRELPADSGCVGRDTSCTSQRGTEDPGGCSCRVVAPVDPSATGWGAAAVLALLLRQRRRWGRARRAA